MTRRIGKSLVQLLTRRAVEIALGVAWPGVDAVTGLLPVSEVEGCAWLAVLAELG